MTDLLANSEQLVALALREDAADRDATTSALIPQDALGKGAFLVKADGVLAGLAVAEAAFRQLDPFVVSRRVASQKTPAGGAAPKPPPPMNFTRLVSDGAAIKRGEVVATVEGSLWTILRAERVALNFLQRLSGIATVTSHYVNAVAGTGVTILDTRKTTPGLRYLEKYAVKTGGGRNHRMDLADGVLVKDNHIAILKGRGMTLGDIVRQAQAKAPRSTPVEIEVTSVAEAEEAIKAGARSLLLDNMGLEEMRQAAALAKKNRCSTEASGGVTLDRIRAVAETGVDFISVGALTHSAKALDISLEIEGA